MDEVTITLPRATFDMAREFIKAFGASLDAADQSIKAGEKAVKAEEQMSGVLGGLDSFGQELNAASNQSMGLM